MKQMQDSVIKMTRMMTVSFRIPSGMCLIKSYITLQSVAVSYYHVMKKNKNGLFQQEIQL